MPASRSRTEHWLDNLKKLHERNGALEISVDCSGTDGESSAGADVVWRVRLVRINDQHMVVEPPAAFGASLDLGAGIKLIGAMTIGQNRWMFHSRTIGVVAGSRHGERFLLLEMPVNVERCTRRSFYRISTANLRLPRVQCWPLIDPSSVIAAEAANRAEIRDLLSGNAAEATSARAASDDPQPVLLPEVGPMFKASLLNVSGGGLGLLVAPDDATALNSRPFVWARLDLRPYIPTPAAVTARVAHTHVDSSQSTYAGLAFDFAHNPSHRAFVVELFSRYVEALQRQQRQSLQIAA